MSYVNFDVKRSHNTVKRYLMSSPIIARNEYVMSVSKMASHLVDTSEGLPYKSDEDAPTSEISN